MTAPRINYWVVGGGMLALFAVAGAATYFFASQHQSAVGPATGNTVAVTVTSTACEPNEYTVPEGRHVFAITNKSNRVLEWEILDGVMVVEERENIAPSYTVNLTTRLDPGEYEIACGLLTNPRGKLHVTANANAPKDAAKPVLKDLIGALAEYRVYVSGELDGLADDTKAFTDAVKAGDLLKAQTLFAPAHAHYERIKPVAELFSDLDKSIDARADSYEKKEADPAFTGFHRIEYGLFAGKTTDGLAPLADKLSADIAAFQDRVTALQMPPARMVGGANVLVQNVVSSGISGQEDRYSHTDISDMIANIEGARKITDLLAPLTTKVDATLQASIDADYTAIEAILDRYKQPDGTFKTYDKLGPEDRAALQKPVTALADSLSSLRGTLGLD